MALEIQGRLFTVRQYHELVTSGILNEDDRVELIEGEIIAMNPIGVPHAAAVDRIAQLLFQGAAGHAIVRVQNPIQLDERSEPQPDLALLRPRPDFYQKQKAHPGPDDILLLVEVADTSLAHDRDVKLPLYARAGIPEVWLVDLASRTVTVHRVPSPEGYRDTLRLAPGEGISLPALPGLHLNTDQLLG